MNEVAELTPLTPVSRSTERSIVSTLTAEAFDSWIKYLDASPKTVQTYTRSIRQFIVWLAENGITRPVREDIRAYRDYLAATGRKPATVAGYLMAVKQFFSWAEEIGLYPNIAKGVRLVEKIDTRTHKHGYLTSKQVQRLLGQIERDSLKGLRDYAMIALMVTTGLRTISVSLATIEDIRPAGDYAALYYQGKGHSEKDTFVKLSEPVEQAIRDYLAARGKTASSDPLFASTAHRNAGKALTTRSIRGMVKDRLSAAGLVSDTLSAHSLRHTAGTLNIRAGGTLQETQQLLDHRQITTTTIYAHAIEREQSKSEERISSLIFGND